MKGIALTVLFTIATSPVLASPVDDAIALYKQRKGDEALAKFTVIVKSDSGNATAHYYRAVLLGQKGMHQGAANEYQMAYNLEPKGEIGRFCRQALYEYKCRGIYSNNTDAGNAYGSVASTTPVVDEQPEPNRLDDIDYKQAMASADADVASIERRVGVMAQEAEREALRMASQMDYIFVPWRGMVPVPVHSPEEVAEYRNKEQARRDYMMDHARQRHKEAEAKAESLLSVKRRNTIATRR